MPSETAARIEELIATELKMILGEDAPQLSQDTVLIGQTAIIKSREVVELLLALEDAMEEEFSVEFDWTSDSAMSEDRSFIRTVGSLRDHLTALAGEN